MNKKIMANKTVERIIADFIIRDYLTALTAGDVRCFARNLLKHLDKQGYKIIAKEQK